MKERLIIRYDSMFISISSSMNEVSWKIRFAIAEEPLVLYLVCLRRSHYPRTYLFAISFPVTD